MKSRLFPTLKESCTRVRRIKKWWNTIQIPNWTKWLAEEILKFLLSEAAREIGEWLKEAIRHHHPL